MFSESNEKPSKLDRSYYPIRQDIRNHIYIAATKLKTSQVDQIDLEEKIKHWKEEDSDRFFEFRPSTSEKRVKPKIKKSEKRKNKQVTDAMEEDEASEFKTSRKISEEEVDSCRSNLLYVHQERWQRKLMETYGHKISLMDATYKTTKYEVPLFFVCVLTNTGYQIVGR